MNKVGILVGLALASPQVSAQTISLDGVWEFAVDSTGKLNIANVKEVAVWRPAQVPLSWQAQFPDLRDFQGVAWYRRRFSAPRLKANQTGLLHFGAVDYRAQVYVNGVLAGEHEGGYLPFEFDVRSHLKPRENELVVRVMDPVADSVGTEGISYWHIPHGKQSWYVQTSGIWQSVSFKVVPKQRITSVRITATMTGSFLVDVKLSDGPRKGGENLKLRIFDVNQDLVFEQTRKLSSGIDDVRYEGSVLTPALWSPDAPNLYSASVSWESRDTAFTRFGFRTFEAKGGRFLLNGEPFYLIGALDQDFYPETVYTTPSKEYLRDEMVKAKQIGLNTLRCHVKVPDPRYLEVADEVGLLVWYEIPNWDVFSKESAERAEATLDGMLNRDWNHPSLVILSLINESWGIDLQKSDQRDWLKKAFERAKARAKGRLVVDNSACWGNFHLKTDINDYHTYWSVPDRADKFAQTVEEMELRPKWLFSSYGDGEEQGSEPLVLSEFGNWGLPKLPDQLPWWFDRPFYDATVVLPKGAYERFSEFQYQTVFGSYHRLAEESQWAQWTALKFEIEQIRLTSPLQGYVITEFTDINWECNGLLDMWRNPKAYAEELRHLQQEDVLIPRSGKSNYWEGDTVEISVALSHFSGRKLEGVRLHWTTQLDSGNVTISAVRQGSVDQIAVVRFRARVSGNPQRIRFNCFIRNGTGEILAQNFCEVFSYPRAYVDPSLVFAVYDPLNALANMSQRLVSLGYRASSLQSNPPLVLTNVLDEQVSINLNKGGTVICFTDTTTVMPTDLKLTLASREREGYDGNWASNLNWLRSDKGPFSSVAFSKRFGFEAKEAIGKFVVEGIPPDKFNDVLAGMFVGWLHLNSAYLVQISAGRGRLLLCTLRLPELVGVDPYATTLFDKLLRYAVSTECKPQLRWQ